MAKLSNQDIIDSLKEMTILEVSELVKLLEETFGISASAVQFASPTGVTASNGTGEVTEEKTKFDVILTDAGAQKISVIKAVREILPELGLKEAKELVESTPKPVKEGTSKEDANAAKEKLEKAGAKVEVK